LTGDFSSLAEFLAIVRKYTDREIRTNGKLEAWKNYCRKTMNEYSDSSGGVLVPPQYADEIIHAALEDSIVRSRAIKHPMTRDKINVPVLVDSDRSSNIFGGVTLTWVEELEDKAQYAADPAIGNLGLNAKKGVATTWVSNELEADYEGGHRDKFENFIKLAFGRAIRFYEDDYYIWGDGVGEPLGVIKSSYLVAPYRSVANEINIVDFRAMAKRLLPGAWATAIWLINPSGFDQLFELQAAAANSASVIDLSRMTILNRPVIVTEHAAQLGNLGDIILADFAGGYVIGDRGLEIAGSRQATYSSNTYGFFQDQTCWRIVLRVDGQPILSSPITPKRGSATDTLSNFVALAATTS
jgi:HK97 family phage major capsid protein